MKFRDPKTGEVFEVEHERCCAKFCDGIFCSNCPIGEKADIRCSDWVNAHPAEAARLMGYEVVEEKEEPMEKKDKPRICEVLGVEVGDRFHISGRKHVYPEDTVYWITQEGYYSTEPPRAEGSSYAILDALNDPNRIIRKPRFTNEEVAKAAHLHGAWGENARLRRTNSNTLTLEQGEGLWLLPNEWFPSLRPGQVVKLSEVIGP